MIDAVGQFVQALHVLLFESSQILRLPKTRKRPRLGLSHGALSLSASPPERLFLRRFSGCWLLGFNWALTEDNKS